MSENVAKKSVSEIVDEMKHIPIKKWTDKQKRSFAIALSLVIMKEVFPIFEQTLLESKKEAQNIRIRYGNISGQWHITADNIEPKLHSHNYLKDAVNYSLSIAKKGCKIHVFNKQNDLRYTTVKK